MNRGRQHSSHHLLNYKSQLISVPEEVLRGPRRLKVLWEPASLLRLASTTLLADPSCSHYFTTGSQSCLFSTSPLLLRVPWTEKRSNQSILKEINPELSLEGLMLKLQYFDTWHEEPTHWKRSDAGKDWGQEEKGVTEDEMVGWHQWLNGHEFEQTPGDSKGQGSLVCCSSWGYKESDMT